ncbi:MAG: YfcE family phosphodiesterase [Oscillospiraceae bacterium]|nr:YfcE family phosphodiesterase [Oscillospiraceae bacterium]
MKILVASDSHGTASGLAEAVEREKPELLLHLGDGISDLISLQIWYPHLLVKQVRGNCDLLEDGLAEQTLLIEGHRILMFHGHTKGVKRGLVKARLAAAKAQAEILLFGHTHRPLYQMEEGLHILNPGSIGDTRQSTYGVLELKKYSISCRIMSNYLYGIK